MRYSYTQIQSSIYILEIVHFVSTMQKICTLNYTRMLQFQRAACDFSSLCNLDNLHQSAWGAKSCRCHTALLMHMNNHNLHLKNGVSP